MNESAGVNTRAGLNAEAGVNAAEWCDVASRVIGVIDLKNGLAVHGVSGDRDNYQPVPSARFFSGAENGNPLDLFAHYSELGLRQFYLADLDALGGESIQKECIESLVRLGGYGVRWLIDAGVGNPSQSETIDWIIELTESSPSTLTWVVASESAASLSTAADFAGHLGPSRVVLGIDFRQREFIGPSCDDGERVALLSSESESPLTWWCRNAANAGIRSALILDVAAVGTSLGPVTLSMCRRFREEYPDWQIISGGGCRSPSDVAAFLRSGCNDCMVATALHC